VLMRMPEASVDEDPKFSPLVREIRFPGRSRTFIRYLMPVRESSALTTAPVRWAHEVAPSEAGAETPEPADGAASRVAVRMGPQH
jgi:hypothetical protein